MAIEKPVTAEIAVITGGRDITRGYVDALPYLPPTDRILGIAGGWKGYEEILRDDQVTATLSQRMRAVIRKPWVVEPASPSRLDKRAAQLVEDTLTNLPWDAITNYVLYANFFGYSVAEILWEAASSGISIKAIRVRDRSRFAFAPDGSLLMFTMQHPMGEPLPERKFWTASVGATHDDEPYGRGLAHTLYWPVWFKRNGARFWSVYLEKFGAPTPIGKFPKGTENCERDKLLQALMAIQTDAAVTVPDNMIIELLEATRGGNANYESYMQYWDASIAKTVLGQTMTTDNGSSLAQAQVHMEVREDFVDSDADLISASAKNSWVKWLVEYNFPGAGIPSIYRDTEVQEDLKTRADRDKALHDQGYRLTPEAVKRIYGDDYEFIGDNAGQPPLAAPKPSGEGGSPAAPGTAGVPPAASATAATIEAAERSPFEGQGPPKEGGAAERRGMSYPDQAALDAAVEAISAETLDAQGRALLAPIMEALQNADDNPEAFLGWLAEQFPHTDPGGLEDMLTRLIFVSELWGQLSEESPFEGQGPPKEGDATERRVRSPFEGGAAERRGMSPDA